MKKIKNKNRKFRLLPLIVIAMSWFILALVLPVSNIWGLITNLILCGLIGTICVLLSKNKDNSSSEELQKTDISDKFSQYSPDVREILEESDRALFEMARIYRTIPDDTVKSKINEIMRITDKISQDAVSDPSDIPQIKRFFSYYLPTTIKLLNAYDRMSSQQIDGENINKSMSNIDDMLDTAIAAYKKRLDSLFADQAVDIETDIEVMNTLMTREGLSDNKDF